MHLLDSYDFGFHTGTVTGRYQNRPIIVEIGICITIYLYNDNLYSNKIFEHARNIDCTNSATIPLR